MRWLLQEKEKAEYQRQGIPTDNFWYGYYTGRLAQIDFALRFITDNRSTEFGGIINENMKDKLIEVNSENNAS